MKTLYAACLSRLGLSQAEAATLHGNSIDTIKKRCAGRIGVPAGVWNDLRAYEARIVDRSEAAREALAQATAAAGSSPEALDARWSTDAELMGLADLILTTDVVVGIVERASGAH